VLPPRRAATGEQKYDSPPLPTLFTPLKMRELTLKNRIVVSPMCQYTCKDGFMTDWHLMHLGQFAAGGAGLVVFEMSAVQEYGRISPYCSGIWKDEHIAPLARIVRFVHSQRAAAGIQIAHAGRKSSTLPPFMVGRGEKVYAEPPAVVGL
jgi:2,4-dienoyl-CoA reductase-like NADH-dependent reductase (Old Yellow Enzyme family)